MVRHMAFCKFYNNNILLYYYCIINCGTGSKLELSEIVLPEPRGLQSGADFLLKLSA